MHIAKLSSNYLLSRDQSDDNYTISVKTKLTPNYDEDYDKWKCSKK